VEAPTVVKAGEPVHVKATITDDGALVKKLKPSAEVASPKMGVDRAIRHYRDALDAVDLGDDEQNADSKEAEDRIRLGRLRRKYMPQTDILPTQYRVHAMQREDDHFIVPVDTTERGTHNVTVNVAGHSPHSDTPFERTKLVSILVV
jgi:hypothetical protein